MEACVKFVLRIKDYEKFLPCGDLCFCSETEELCADEYTVSVLCSTYTTTTTTSASTTALTSTTTREV